MEILWERQLDEEKRALAKRFYINSTDYSYKASVAAFGPPWYMINFSALIYEPSRAFVTYRKASGNHHMHVANGAEDLQGAAPA